MKREPVETEWKRERDEKDEEQEREEDEVEDHPILQADWDSVSGKSSREERIYTPTKSAEAGTRQEGNEGKRAEEKE